MKNFFHVLIFLIFASCSNNDRKEVSNYSSLSFSTDTVIVNPGDDIINLANGIWFSALGRDNSILYNFSQETSQLEIIDLSSLVLD